MSDTDPEPVDTADTEDTEILLADPDDYHQAQRLREIHEARRNVHTTLNKVDGFTDEKTHHKQRANLSHAVVLYASELLPPANAADLDTSLSGLPWDSIEHYVHAMGADPEDAEAAAYNYHNLVFQRCNALLAEMKPLIEQDDTDEWEV